MGEWWSRRGASSQTTRGMHVKKEEKQNGSKEKGGKKGGERRGRRRIETPRGQGRFRAVKRNGASKTDN